MPQRDNVGLIPEVWLVMGDHTPKRQFGDPTSEGNDLVGSKEPFECVVCLCEFDDEDELRLPPTCGHAFHLGCIDTCMLSNSTCSLCWGSLYLQGDAAAMENPMFDFGDSREEEEDEEAAGEAVAAVAEEGSLDPNKRVFPVRLGKFKSLGDVNGDDDDDEGGGIAIAIGRAIAVFAAADEVVAPAEDTKGTMKLLKRMKDAGCGPKASNSYTFFLILDKIFKFGDSEIALKIWTEMRRYNIIPDATHYMVVVEGLIKHGWIPKALEFYNEIKSKGFHSRHLLARTKILIEEL
ncbi:hypothetical protein Cni_G06928 [Canna indica]|uniref:RING-type domain-containing protein n=1 Tax=Canna indica TaxID=4628 RepID=A0AAQ3JZH1_9LILI|nr:hypothetical protein Cni_G06928 [Canna indica]